MRDIDPFDELNGVKYLFLKDLTEPEENSLRIVAAEGLPDPSKPLRLPQLPELAEILKDAVAIESGPGCRMFELSWRRYVAYLVTEEMAGSCGEYGDEIFIGKLLRIYAKSHFLDHLSRDTGAHEKPILHYKLTCQNHLIDVASYDPPEIRML